MPITMFLRDNRMEQLRTEFQFRRFLRISFRPKDAQKIWFSTNVSVELTTDFINKICQQQPLRSDDALALRKGVEVSFCRGLLAESERLDSSSHIDRVFGGVR